MILDHSGTEYRSGRLIKPKGLLYRQSPMTWWEQQGYEIVYQITAYKKGTKDAIWRGRIYDFVKALRFWTALSEGSLVPNEWDIPTPMWHPGLTDVEYHFIVVQYFGPGAGTFTVPAGYFDNVDWVLCAGGGGGAVGSAGGGGGVVFGTTPVPLASYAWNIGTGGAGGSGGDAVQGVNSTFALTGTTVLGGGRGADQGTTAGGYAGGCGSAARWNAVNVGGAGTAGQGFAGGNLTTNVSPFPTAGGGGAGAVGTSVSGGTPSGIGGAGKVWSVTGITLGGGGGGNACVQGATAAAGGIGGGGGGGGGGGTVPGGAGGTNTAGANPGLPGTSGSSGVGGTGGAGGANTGGGGGGGGSGGGWTRPFGGAGGTGLLGVAYEPVPVGQIIL
jgi:hypothetical protein